MHCVESVRIRSYSDPYFPAFKLITPITSRFFIWWHVSQNYHSPCHCHSDQSLMSSVAWVYVKWKILTNSPMVSVTHSFYKKSLRKKKLGNIHLLLLLCLYFWLQLYSMNFELPVRPFFQILKANLRIMLSMFVVRYLVFSVLWTF